MRAVNVFCKGYSNTILAMYRFNPKERAEISKLTRDSYSGVNVEILAVKVPGICGIGRRGISEAVVVYNLAPYNNNRTAMMSYL